MTLLFIDDCYGVTLTLTRRQEVEQWERKLSDAQNAVERTKLRHQRMTRLRLFPAGEHAQEAQLGSTYGARGFRGVLLPGDGPIQLQRIATSVEEE